MKRSLLIIYAILAAFFVWLSVYTSWSVVNILKTDTNIAIEARKAVVAFPPTTYNPVIAGIVNSNVLSIDGSSSSVSVYQYVAVQKATNATQFVDSTATPRTALPLFSTTLTQVSFPGGLVFQNGDIFIHSFYTSNVITGGLQPVASVTLVYYEACYVDYFGNVPCWTGTTFCSYPLTLGLGGTNTLNTLNQAFQYMRQNVDNNVFQNPSNGCYVTLHDPTTLTPAVIAQVTQTFKVAQNEFKLSVNSQLGTRRFCLPIVDYVQNPSSLNSLIINSPNVDFYVNFGDGSAIQHFQGVLNPQTTCYDYPIRAANAAVVTVTIVGNVVGWDSAALYDHKVITTLNPMLLDVLQWGDVNLQTAGFGYEQYMTAFTAGSPPKSLQKTYGFFPAEASPNVWANLQTWDISNIKMTLWMFYYIRTGSLNIANWNMSGIVNGDSMFLSTTVPLDGSSWVFSSLQTGSNMFHGANVGNLNTATWDMRSARVLSGMFYNYPRFVLPEGQRPAVADIRYITGVENWNTANLEDVARFCAFSYGCATVNVGPWTTPKIKIITGMFFATDNVVVSFHGWTLSGITDCACAFKNSNANGNREISPSTNYNEILDDWNTKTPVSLVCNWGNPCPGLMQPDSVNLIATTASRSALAARGWCIKDGAGSIGTCA